MVALLVSRPSTRAPGPRTATVAHVHTELARGTDILLGHRRCAECAPNDLVPIAGAFRTERLRPSAARAFTRMQRAARRDGVHLHLVSGFRSVAEQEALYFGVKAARVQSARERARVSAPPGYSEHHSGYALDISDEALSLDVSFAQSPAYRWLQENARGYNFELSFPEDGAVAFEPWHWRYEGDLEAIKTFYEGN